jgi:hypothetical protein
MAANLAGIGRRALLEKIVAAAPAARVATIVVPAADPVVVKAVAKVAPGMKAGRVAAADVPSKVSLPISNWRS